MRIGFSDIHPTLYAVSPWWNSAVWPMKNWDIITPHVRGIIGIFQPRGSFDAAQGAVDRRSRRNWTSHVRMAWLFLEPDTGLEHFQESYSRALEQGPLRTCLLPRSIRAWTSNKERGQCPPSSRALSIDLICLYENWSVMGSNLRRRGGVTPGTVIKLGM